MTGNHAVAAPSGGTGGGVDLASKYGGTISNTTISGNTATVRGGGAVLSASGKYGSPVTLGSSTVSGNQAPGGAGVDVPGVGSRLAINASTISGNQGGANSFGGGLLVDGYVTGSLDVSDSTISGRSPPLP